MSKLLDEWGFFTPMPEIVIDMWPAIGTDAVAMFLYLRFRTNKERTNPRFGSAWPSFNDIREHTGIGFRRISRGLKKLEESGLLHRRKRYGQSVVYTLKRPPDVGVHSITSVEGLTNDSIREPRDKYSHSENISITTVADYPYLKKQDLKKQTNKDSNDQTFWVQTLTAILQTYYKGKETGDFSLFWQPTVALGSKNGVVTILCEHGIEQQDWLQDRQKIAERMLVGVLGKTTKVVFVTGDEDVDNS